MRELLETSKCPRLERQACEIGRSANWLPIVQIGVHTHGRRPALARNGRRITRCFLGELYLTLLHLLLTDGIV